MATRPFAGAIGETPDYTSRILTIVAFVPLASNVIVQLWNIVLALAEARAKKTAGIKGALFFFTSLHMSIHMSIHPGSYELLAHEAG